MPIEYNYSEIHCPLCDSTDVFVDYDTFAFKYCRACYKEKTKQQGVIAWRLNHGPLMVGKQDNIWKGEIKIRKPFGVLFKWLSVKLTWNKNYNFGWCFRLIYSEQFIPKEFCN